VIVRPAEEGDLSALPGVEDQGMASPWSSGRIVSEFAHPLSRIFVLVHDSQVPGYAAFRTCASEGELLRLVVLPAWRRQGWAGRLLRYGLRQLAGHGMETCFLEVRSSNTAARSLYEQHGFTNIGMRPKYYRQPMEDAVLMRYDTTGLQEG
jgi:ribosomal-protein-alanine N-acetyltransferase